MTDAFWTTLIASLLSATAALSGVALTNRHALRRHQAEQQEKLRGQQREIIAEIVLAGREYADRQWVWVAAIGQMNEKDFVEFAQTDASKSMGDVLDRLNVALVKADLFIPASDLKEEITSLAEFVQSFPTSGLGPVIEHPGDLSKIVNGQHAVDTFRSKLFTMSKNASHRLGVQDPLAQNKRGRLGTRLAAAWSTFKEGKGV